MMKGEEEKKFEKRGGFIPQLGSLSVRTVSHLWMEYLMTSSGGIAYTIPLSWHGSASNSERADPFQKAGSQELILDILHGYQVGEPSPQCFDFGRVCE